MRVVEHVVDARRVAAQGLELARREEEGVHRRHEAREEDLEGDEVAHAEAAVHDAHGAEPEHAQLRDEAGDGRDLHERDA